MITPAISESNCPFTRYPLVSVHLVLGIEPSLLSDLVHPQGLEPCSQAWKACDSTSLSSGAYKAIFFPFAWLSVKFFIAKIPAHSDTVLSSERASYLRQRKTNKRTNFLFYISQTFRTITSLAAVALRHTLIGIRVLVPTWYSIRESNSVLYLERVATQPICLMEYN